MLEAATTAWIGWREQGIELPIAVNVSAHALLGDRLVGQVAESLDRSGIPPGMLTLEITETALMDAGPEAAGKVFELRHLGVAIALDDFGTGYSSLRRLASLPLDELKIDRSFVTAMGADDRALAVMRLIVDLGRELQLVVTAEGVETQAEFDQLSRLGCDAVQGFLFARPMPQAQLLEWLELRDGLTCVKRERRAS